MQRFHDWYMETCRKFAGEKKMDILTLKVKDDHHVIVGIEQLSVPFEEFFQFFNQKALDKLMVTSHLLLSVSTTSIIKSLYIAQLFHCMYI